VNGAGPEQLLAAALAVARELCDQKIRELEHDLEESNDECSRLEDELRDLRNGLKELLEEDR
jgi:septal ring factor EnvC (AmiA/AmiB activator)